MVVKLNFDSDFTWLLDEEVKNINHTVKVITKNSVIACCGAILSQHSNILRKLITEEAELFLDNYTHVRDCLVILHGGEVTLNIGNILDVLKFSVQFKVDEVYMQCLNWIKDNLSADNFLDMFKICNSLSKFAQMQGNILCEDIFQSVAIYIRMIGPSAVKNLVVAESSIEEVVDLANFFLSSRGMFISFAKQLFELITQKNVHIMFPLLSKNMDMFKFLTLRQFESLVSIMDSAVVENSGVTSKTYFSFKETILLEYMKSTTHISKSIPNGTKCLIDAILMNKSWKEMDSNQLVGVQQLFQSPSQHFLYAEMMIAWVVEKKPENKVVSNITQSLIPYNFNAEYFEMLARKFKALGYHQPISSRMLSMWKQPSHFIQVGYDNKVTSTGFVTYLNRQCRNAVPCSTLTYYVNFQPSTDVITQRISWKWCNVGGVNNYGGNIVHNVQFIDAPLPTLTTEFLKCPKESAEVSCEKEELFFYGATRRNDPNIVIDHIPFQTDELSVVKSMVNSRPGVTTDIKCIQFEKPTDCDSDA